MKEVTREQLKTEVEKLIKLAKEKKGELVIYSKGAEEEYGINSMKEFTAFKTKNGDLVEVTIYDRDDDDLYYEEFTIAEADKKSTTKNKGEIKGVATEIKEKEKAPKKFKKENHFAQFMKK